MEAHRAKGREHFINQEYEKAIDEYSKAIVSPWPAPPPALVCICERR